MRRLFEKRWVRIYVCIATVGLLIAFVVVPLVRGWGMPDWSGKSLTDDAGLLTEENHLAINATAERLAKQSNIDVRICLLNSLQGKAIDQYAQRLYDHWGVGRKALNGGVLLVLSVEDAAAYSVSGGNFAKFLPSVDDHQVAAGDTHAQVMRLLDETGKNLRAFRSTDLALKPEKGISIWEKLAPLWVVLGIAVIMVPIVLQERMYFFRKKDNRGGIHRPMYNVGGGSMGPVNYSARGKN